MAKRAKASRPAKKASGAGKKKPSDDASPQKPVSYSVGKIESVAQALREFAAEIDGHVAEMKDSSIDELMVRERMVLRSMGHLGDFCDQLKTKIRKAKGVSF